MAVPGQGHVESGAEATGACVRGHRPGSRPDPGAGVGTRPSISGGMQIQGPRQIHPDRDEQLARPGRIPGRES